MRRILTALTTAALALAIAVPAAAKQPAPAAAAKPGDRTIVQIASASSDFNVLVAAVVKAGLAGALNGKGQFTVFAPTDAAFEATFESLLGMPLTEADVIAFIQAGGVDAAFGPGALANILLYHVTEGRRISTSVLAAPTYEMLNGGWLTRAELVAAGIVPANISASNGIIHVLSGSVLLP